MCVWGPKSTFFEIILVSSNFEIQIASLWKEFFALFLQILVHTVKEEEEVEAICSLSRANKFCNIFCLQTERRS